MQLHPENDYRRDVKLEIESTEGRAVGFFDCITVGGLGDEFTYFVILNKKPNGNGDVVAAVPFREVRRITPRLEIGHAPKKRRKRPGGQPADDA